MSLRIFHTSDLHLGMKFAGYPEVQVDLSEARFKTLEKLVALANKEECDLFIISGDLFDRVSIAKRDILRASQILQDFQGRLVVVLPGNHDFISGDKTDLWLHFRDNAPANVLILNEERIYPLQHYDLDVYIYAAPCNAKHSGENAVTWIKESSKDSNVLYHIGIAHGSLEGFSPDFDQRYFPMTLQELQKCGLDLWLMGHTHSHYPVKPGDLDMIFYPGTPEPDGFDCQHEGTAWIIEIDEKRKIHATLISTGTHRFLHEEAEVSSSKDLEALKEKYTAQNYKQTLLKLKIKGRLPQNEYTKLPEIKRILQERLFYLLIDDDGVTEQITLERINQEFTEGSFPYKLLAALACDSESLQIAYDLIREIRR